MEEKLTLKSESYDESPKEITNILEVNSDDCKVKTETVGLCPNITENDNGEKYEFLPKRAIKEHVLFTEEGFKVSNKDESVLNNTQESTGIIEKNSVVQTGKIIKLELTTNEAALGENAYQGCSDVKVKEEIKQHHHVRDGKIATECDTLDKGVPIKQELVKGKLSFICWSVTNTT